MNAVKLQFCDQSQYLVVDFNGIAAMTDVGQVFNQIRRVLKSEEHYLCPMDTGTLFDFEDFFIKEFSQLLDKKLQERPELNSL